MARYQIKLRKMYAILTNLRCAREVPEHLTDRYLETMIASWMGIFRENTDREKAVDALLWSATCLCSQVEMSIAGQKGSHKIAITNVRKNIEKVKVAFKKV
jgi:hypothetical protein